MVIACSRNAVRSNPYKSPLQTYMLHRNSSKKCPIHRISETLECPVYSVQKQGSGVLPRIMHLSLSMTRLPEHFVVGRFIALFISYCPIHRSLSKVWRVYSSHSVSIVPIQSPHKGPVILFSRNIGYVTPIFSFLSII